MKMKSFSLSRIWGAEVPEWRRLAFWGLSTCLLFGIIALGVVGAPNVCWSADEGGASGYLEQSEALTSPDWETADLAAVVVTYALDAYAIWKTHGSEIAILSTGQQAIWKFKVHSWCDHEPIGCITPGAFTVTAVDSGGGRERIRIAVSKVGTTGTVIRSAVPPSVASYGLKVKDGDIIQVVVDYPYGFVPGNWQSIYALQWVLHNN